MCLYDLHLCTLSLIDACMFAVAVIAFIKHRTTLYNIYISIYVYNTVKHGHNKHAYYEMTLTAN